MHSLTRCTAWIQLVLEGGPRFRWAAVALQGCALGWHTVHFSAVTPPLILNTHLYSSLHVLQHPIRVCYLAPQHCFVEVAGLPHLAES